MVDGLSKDVEERPVGWREGKGREGGRGRVGTGRRSMEGESWREFGSERVKGGETQRPFSLASTPHDGVVSTSCAGSKDIKRSRDRKLEESESKKLKDLP